MKPQYYVDMDGVLAVWNQNASEEETHEPGYFLNREVELSAVAFVRLLANKASGKVSILSSVYEDDHSAEEKNIWLNRAGLADLPRIFVPYGRDKHEFINTEDTLPVLIDDYSKNLRAWEDEGYLAFKFMNGFNNQPKLKVVDGIVHVNADSWEGYSIDRRMTPKQMLTLVTSVSNAVAEAAERESA